MTASTAENPELPDARQRLLEAAEEVFASKGFDSATVREICSRAGVNIAAINYYFGDKERLYIETVKFAHSCATSSDTFPLLLPGATAVERLTVFIGEMARRMHAPARPTSMKLMMREMSEPGKAADVVVKEFIQPLAFRLRDILGELLPHETPKQLLMIGFSIIGQCLFYRQNRPVAELIFGKEAVGALDVTSVTEHVVRFTLAALGHARPIGSEPPDAARRDGAAKP